MEKLKLKEESGTYVAKKSSGQVMTCPYRQMKVIEKKGLGLNEQVIIQVNQACTSDCAKFQTVSREGKNLVELTCGRGTQYEFEIEAKK